MVKNEIIVKQFNKVTYTTLTKNLLFHLLLF